MSDVGRQMTQISFKTLVGLLISISVTRIGETDALGCYTCMSKNRSDFYCEDTFNENFLHAGMEDRNNMMQRDCRVPILEGSGNHESDGNNVASTKYINGTELKTVSQQAKYCIKIIGTIGTEDAKEHKRKKTGRKRIIGQSMIIRSCVTQSNLNWMCGKFRFENDDISGCMLTCDKDFCNGATILSETGINAFLLTIALCMAATHIVLFLMLGFDPFEIYNI